MPKLTPLEVTSVCSAAAAAWTKASPSARTVSFVWGGRRYRSKLTSFRMLVETAAGQPVACRYH